MNKLNGLVENTKNTNNINNYQCVLKSYNFCLYQITIRDLHFILKNS